MRTHPVIRCASPFLMVLGLWAAAGALPAFAQVKLQESFDSPGAVAAGTDGPANLVSRGWIFRNQSAPRGTTTWHAGTDAEYGYSPQAGAGCLGVNATSTQDQGVVSNWAILPAVPGQLAGDQVRFFVRGYPVFQDDNRLQLRYSPSGSVGTGAGPTTVGDFSVLLAEANPDSYTWTEVAAAVPGGGRLAIRYYKPVVPNINNPSMETIDTLTVGAGSSVSIIPGPGQTVHWTAAMSPVRIESDTDIPTGGTVIVDPGVTVSLAADAHLRVLGRLQTAGVAGARVFITADQSTAGIGTAAGELDFHFTDVNVQLGIRSGGPQDKAGSAAFSDCTFQQWGLIHGGWNYTGVDRCIYNGAYPPSFSHAVRINQFTSGKTVTLRQGIYVLNALTVQGASGSTLSQGAGLWLAPGIQGAYLDGVRLLDNAQAGVFLAGGNTLVGPNNLIQGNSTAIELGGGLLAGSVLPASGNRANGFISIGEAGPSDGFPGSPVSDMTLEDVGLPYVIGDGHVIFAGSGRALTVGAGVQLRLGADSGLSSGEGGQLFLEGKPGTPISLSARETARPWGSVSFAYPGGRVVDCDLSGSRQGVTTFSGIIADLLNSNIHDNQYGGLRGVRARKSTFTRNTLAAISNAFGDIGSGVPQLASAGNPNSFVQNAVGVEDAFNGAHFDIDARYCWWGSGAGPGTPANPGGQGDPVLGRVLFSPFRTTPPDLTDHPPVVLAQSFDALEPGTRVTLRWTASDDRGIVRQRLAYSQGSNGDEQGFIVFADNLPGNQRAFEWTVPAVGFSNRGPTTYIRIIATDTAGQEGYAELQNDIPDQARTGTITMSPNLAGAVFAPGDLIPLALTGSGFDAFFSGFADVYLELLNNDHWEYMSSSRVDGQPFSEIRLPCVSTDRARLVVRAYGSYNRMKYFFSPTFSIRPDARLGDAPPVVTITSPQPGQTFPAGGSIPVTWTSSDDQGVRSMRLYASSDAGRTWQHVADHLPAAGSYSLPAATTTTTPVLIRVSAVDTRFQDSSADVQAIAGSAVCIADFDRSGVVGVQDIFAYLSAWFARDSKTDINGVGGVTLQDVFDFLTAWFVGCP